MMRRRWLAVVTMGVLGACGDDGAGSVRGDTTASPDGGDTSVDSSGGGANDGVDSTSSDDGGGGGDAAGGQCPLDAVARSRFEATVASAIADAGWIVSGTHGQGQFASRAWGTSIPFTDIGVLYSASLAVACDAPGPFDPYCEGDGDHAALQRCSQLECLEAGAVQARGWFEGLPLTVASTDGDGDITVTGLEAKSVTRELGEGGLDLSWDNRFAIVFDDASAFEGLAIGSARVAEEVHELASLVVRGSASDWTLELLLTEDDAGQLYGSGKLDSGAEIVQFLQDGFIWAESCPR